MKFAATAVALASLASTVAAHATVQAVWINGSDKGAAAIRSPPNNNPVKDPTSSSMYCNVNGNTAKSTWLPVAGGDTVTFEWAHNSRGDDIIASSHKGPVLVYITKDGSNSWVKLDQRGNGPSGNWATDVLIGNTGRHWIRLPNLPAGKYLLRPEWITLHEGDTAYASNPARGTQLYMECIQIEVTSNGSASLPSGVAFPGAYSASSLVYNLYGSSSAYPFPGPSVWSGNAGGGYGLGGASTGGGGNTGGNTGGQTTTRQQTTTTRQQQTTTTTTRSSGGSGAALYGQCGGKNWTGPTTCASGTCKYNGEYYSQCLP